MEIKLETFKEYIQKSKLFLLPLLNTPNDLQIIETYLGIKNLKLCDGYSLVILLYNEQPNYKQLKVQLEKNKFFDFLISDAEFDIAVFDFSSVKDEYNKILNGQYSKLSKTAKILIKHNNKDERASIGINPEYYYKNLAELLEYPEEHFINTELISPPDMDNEMLNVTKNVFSELTNDYKIPVVNY